MEEDPSLNPNGLKAEMNFFDYKSDVRIMDRPKEEIALMYGIKDVNELFLLISYKGNVKNAVYRLDTYK